MLGADDWLLACRNVEVVGVRGRDWVKCRNRDRNTEDRQGIAWSEAGLAVDRDV